MTAMNSYERLWLGIAVAAIAGMLVVVIAAGFLMGYGMPGMSGKVDPRNLINEPPFDKPGVMEMSPGNYEVVMIASTWQYTPAEIKVPAGAQVKFMITSRDVTHGILVEGTNINMMIVPGQVTEFTTTFAKPGEYPFMCHEYCGVGHQAMTGKIIVLP
jgi:cytochrome c oxidase subunit II